MSRQTKKSSRNWTKAETNLFCEILVDPITNFMQTLEQKALKKTSAKQVYDEIVIVMKEAMKIEPFLSKNAECRKNKSDLVELDIDHKRLQTKYNNIKQQWKQISDSKKNGSGLAGKDDPEWFIIVNPVLSDTNGGINEVCSGPSDTSLAYNVNMEKLDSDSEAEEEIDYDAPSSEEHESGSESVSEHIRKRKSTSVTHAEKIVKDAKNKKVVAKPHEKRSVARSQLQAMSQLAAGVNKLAEVNARKMAIEERDRKSLLEFRREEAEKTREHEKYMAELYLRMSHSPSFNSNPFIHNQLSSSLISPSEYIPPLSSNTPPFSPVNRIGATSTNLQPASVQSQDGQNYPFRYSQINNS